MKKPTISALILTRNEAEKLPGCLRKLDWVDEIVVLDDVSTDETLNIAKKFGAKIYKRKLDNFASQRNFGLSKIKTDWVLLIDPDEKVTPELKKEIQKAARQKKYNGYYFPRKNIIFGQWIKHTGWYPDYQLHLFKTKKGKYVGQVHEQMELEGEAGYLKNHLIHHNYQTISQYLKKLDQYTDLAAKMKIETDFQLDLKKIIKEPTAEFLKRFFAEKGYRDGLHGLILSLLQTFSILVVLAKVWEKQGFKEMAGENILGKTGKELSRARKEFQYWFLTSQIEKGGFFKKTALKVKRRLKRIL